jgi:FG-GAP-like repeat/Tyrosine-protein kinase ephrin type A/B receptor-like/Chlamydia polymorphic membrane protein (Chlamydia_PMP) repeat
MKLFSSSICDTSNTSTTTSYHSQHNIVSIRRVQVGPGLTASRAYIFQTPTILLLLLYSYITICTCNVILIVNATPSLNSKDIVGGFNSADPISTTFNGLAGIALCDFNGDSVIDVAVSSVRDAGMTAFITESDGTFTGVPISIEKLYDSSNVQIACGDVTNNGFADVVSLALVSSTLRGVQLYKNNGVGNGYTRASIDDTLDSGTDIKVYDMDRDGSYDIIAGATNPSRLRVYLNIGNDGTFPTPPIAIDVDAATLGISADGQGIAAIEPHDLDLDGVPELIVATASGTVVVFAQNTSAPSFTMYRQRLLTAEAPSKPTIAVGDLTGDIFPEIVVSALTAPGVLSRILLFENSGVVDGELGVKFTECARLPTSRRRISAVAIAEIDSDSSPDILVASQDADGGFLEYYLNSNNTCRGFVNPTQIETSLDTPGALAVADLDGDGRSDVISGSQQQDSVVWYRNMLRVYAKVQPGLPNVDAFNLIACDITGNGEDDLVVMGGNSELRWHAVTSSGFNATGVLITSSLASSSIRVIQCADINNDQRMDIVLLSEDLNAVVWFEQLPSGPASWSAIQFVARNLTLPRALLAADFNLDGYTDLFFADIGRSATSISSRLYVSMNLRNGTFHTRLADQLNASIVTATAGLVDGDEWPDLVVGSFNSGTSYWIRNINQGLAWENYQLSNALYGATSVVLADMDGDSDLDIIVASFSSDNVVWIANDGFGGFEEPRLVGYADAVLSIQILDYDFDGDLDILCRQADTVSNIVIFPNLGNAIAFDDPVVVVSNVQYLASAAGYFGRGMIEIIAAKDAATGPGLYHSILESPTSVLVRVSTASTSSDAECILDANIPCATLNQALSSDTIRNRPGSAYIVVIERGEHTISNTLVISAFSKRNIILWFDGPVTLKCNVSSIRSESCIRMIRRKGDTGEIRWTGRGTVAVVSDSSGSTSSPSVRAIHASLQFPDDSIALDHIPSRYTACRDPAPGMEPFQLLLGCLSSQAHSAVPGQVQVRISGFSTNSTGAGLYIDQFSRLDMRNSVIEECASGSTGGAISVTDSSTVQLTNMTLQGNRAQNLGGAIYATSNGVNVTIMHSDVIENVAVAGCGGAIHVENVGTSFNSVAVLVDRCVLRDNVVLDTSHNGHDICTVTSLVSLKLLTHSNMTSYSQQSIDTYGGSSFFSSSLGVIMIVPPDPQNQLAAHLVASSSGCRTGQVQLLNGTLLCSSCSPGQAMAAADGTCELCTRGRFTADFGSTSCNICPEGTAAVLDGSVTCVECNSGTYMDVQQGKCVFCGRGRYASDPRSTSCTDCSPGRFARLIGSIACQDCPAGSYAEANRSFSCTPCELHSFANNARSTSCTPCPDLRFANRTGSQFCDQCDTDRYLIFSNRSDTSTFQGCQACVDSADCSTGRPLARGSYWIDFNSRTGEAAQVYRCPNARACEQSGQCGANRLPSQLNLLCAACIDGFQELGGECIECSETHAGLLFVMFIVLALGVLLLHFSAQTSSASTTVLLYSVQMTSLFLGDNSDIGILQLFAMLDFDVISAGGTTCIVPLTPAGQILAQFATIAVAFAVWAACFAIAAMLHTVGCISHVSPVWHVLSAKEQHRRASVARERAETQAIQMQHLGGQFKERDGQATNVSSSSDRVLPPTSVDRRRWYRSLIALYLFTFNRVVATAFSALNCVQVSFNGLSKSVLYDYPTIECSRSNSDYGTVQALAILMLLLYMGVALLILALLWRRFHSRRPQPSSISSHSSMVFGVLTFVFRADFWFWRMLIVCRRFLLVVVVVFWREDRAWQFTLATSINVVVLLFHSLNRPFKQVVDNYAEFVSLLSLTFLTLVLQRATMPYEGADKAYLTCLAVLPFVVLLLWLLIGRLVSWGHIVHPYWRQLFLLPEEAGTQPSVPVALDDSSKKHQSMLSAEQVQEQPQEVKDPIHNVVGSSSSSWLADSARAGDELCITATADANVSQVISEPGVDDGGGGGDGYGDGQQIPAGWQMFITDEDAIPYYFCAATGESRWEFPPEH